jgi:hypothetical protein
VAIGCSSAGDGVGVGDAADVADDGIADRDARSQDPDGASPHSDGATPDGAATCSSTLATLCRLDNAYSKECGPLDACTAAEISSCDRYWGQFSCPFLQALDACWPQTSACSRGDAGASVVSTCVDAKVAMLNPSAAQERLKDDFCAECPDGSSKIFPDACSTFFSAAEGGVGSIAMIYPDSFSDRVDQECVAALPAEGSGGDCADRFVACSGEVYTATAYVPTECSPDGG